MAIATRHVAADAAADQDCPKQRHRQVGEEMNQQAQTDMEEAKQPFGPMQPACIVQPFEDEKQAAGGDGQVVPLGQAGNGHQQDETAKEHGGHADVAGADGDAQPAHGAGGLFGVPGGGAWGLGL